MRLRLIDLDQLRLPPAQLALPVCLFLIMVGIAGTILGQTPASLAHAPPGLFVSLGTSVAAFLTGTIGLFFAQSRGRPPRPAAPAFQPLIDPPPGVPMADAQAVLNDFRRLLAEARQDAAAMREQYGARDSEAVLVGARLAGVALDAEHRLIGSVDQIEQALRRQDGPLTRATAAIQRLEQDAAGIAQMIGAQLEATVAAREAADQRLQAITDELARTLGGLVAEAQGRGSDILESANLVRREAQLLSSAGRKIAMASAGVVQQLGEAADKVEPALARALVQTIEATLPAALAPLPATIAQLRGAAADVTQSAAQASAVLRADTAAMTAFGQDWARATGQMRQEADLLRGTAAAAVTQVAESLLHASRSVDQLLGRMADQVGAGVATLTQEVATLTAAGDGVAAAGTAATASITQAAVQLDQMTAAAGAAIAADHSAMMRTGGSIEDAARALRQEAADLSAEAKLAQAAIAAVAERAEVSAAALQSAGQVVRVLGEDTGGQVARLADLADRAEAQAAVLPQVAAGIEAWLAQLQTAVPDLASAGLEVRRHVESLPRIQSAAAADAAAAARAMASAQRLAGQLSETTGQLAAAMSDQDRLDGITARFEQTLAGVPSAIAALSDRLPLELDRIAASVMQASRQAADDRPVVLDSLSCVAGELRRATGLIETLGHRQDDAAERLAASIAALPGAAAPLAPANECPVVLDSLSGLAAELRKATGLIETVGHRQDDAAQRLAAAIAALRGAAVPLSAEAAVAGADAAAPSLVLTLQHLAGIERQSAALLRHTEGLAEAVMTGRTPDLPGMLAAQTPIILAGLDTTVHQLHAAATALALASDGPATKTHRPGAPRYDCGKEIPAD